MCVEVCVCACACIVFNLYKSLQQNTTASFFSNTEQGWKKKKNKEKKRALPPQQSSRPGRTLFPRPNLYQVEWSCSSFFLTGTYWLLLLPSHSKKKKRGKEKKRRTTYWALHKTVWGVRFSRRVKGTCCYCTLDQGSVRLRAVCIVTRCNITTLCLSLKTPPVR